jgi:hypothetical protein
VPRPVVQLHRGDVAERHPDADAHRPADEHAAAPGHTQPDTRTHDQRAAYDHDSPTCDVLCAADVRPTNHDELAADIGCRDD